MLICGTNEIQVWNRVLKTKRCYLSEFYEDQVQTWLQLSHGEALNAPVDGERKIST